MYAVVKTGGKQVKLEKGMTEVVEKLDAPVGGTVTFTPLFVSDDGKALAGSEAAGVTVTAEVVEHFKGDKQLVFKFKKRKGYKKLNGHRQAQTRIRVTDIAVGEAPKKPAAKAAPKAEAEAAAAPVAVEAPAKKPAAKIAAKAKPEAAEKPTAAKKAAPKAKAEAAEKPAEEKPKRTRKPAAKKEAPAEPAE